jgi:pimeloyl-ACP methyl ester carboxylesterase
VKNPLSRAAAALAAAALLFATACTGADGGTAPVGPTGSSTPPGLGAYYGQSLAWHDCRDGFQCATLQVPEDYAKPDGARLKLAVIRLRATGKRIGSLVLNPGGPGGSGVEYTRAARSVLSAELQKRFDAVGFDPRGVAGSAPVRCLNGKQMDAYLNGDPTPETSADIAALQRNARAMATGCEHRDGTLLKHISTAESARDMDILRAALGDQKLTYLGKSYGTYLGALYAQQFPTRVRALVLDGAVDPEATGMRMVTGQADGFRTALRAFVADCQKRSGCPVGGATPQAGVEDIARRLKALDAKPLRVPGDPRALTEGLATYGVLSALYDKGSWSYLEDGLRELRAGNGRTLLAMADSLSGRQPNGTYNNSTDAMNAIGCVDQPWPRGLSAYKTAAAQAAKQSPPFGAELVWTSLPCAYWPVASPKAAPKIHAAGAPPILVVGTTRDPATPLPWAKSLATQLASGVLLTRDGDGHTAYLMGNPCVDQKVDTYLTTTTPPKPNTTCPA